MSSSSHRRHRNGISASHLLSSGSSDCNFQQHQASIETPQAYPDFPASPTTSYPRLPSLATYGSMYARGRASVSAAHAPSSFSEAQNHTESIQGCTTVVPTGTPVADDLTPSTQTLSPTEAAYSPEQYTSKQTATLFPPPFSDGNPSVHEPHWHWRHINAEPGRDLTWGEYLSDEFPGPQNASPSYNSVTEAAFLNPNGHSSTLSQWQTSHHFTADPSLSATTDEILHAAVWPSPCYFCKEGEFYENDDILNVHLWTEHGNTLIWSPRQCGWEGCKLENVFQNAKKWLTHVKAVHQKSFSCSHPDCEFKTPFGTITDLNRHRLCPRRAPFFAAEYIRVQVQKGQFEAPRQESHT